MVGWMGGRKTFTALHGTLFINVESFGYSCACGCFGPEIVSRKRLR